jgi:hypothetical protein
MQPTHWVSIDVGNGARKSPFLCAGAGSRAIILRDGEGSRRGRVWIDDHTRTSEAAEPIHPGFGRPPGAPHMLRSNDPLYLSFHSKVTATISVAFHAVTGHIGDSAIF